MISQKEDRNSRELAAAEDSPYLTGKSPRRPLQPLPPSASDPATCGFSEDAMRGHAFFKECAAAVEANNADAVVPAAEGIVQDMSDDETAPAAVYWAFASIEDNVHAFLNYISSEVRFENQLETKQFTADLEPKTPRAVTMHAPWMEILPAYLR